MAKKKLILNESVTRRFMKLATIKPTYVSNFLTEAEEDEEREKKEAEQQQKINNNRMMLTHPDSFSPVPINFGLNAGIGEYGSAIGQSLLSYHHNL